MKTHEQLIAQLQAQADVDMPAFSDDLHRQVMTAVRQAPSPSPFSSLSPSPGTPGEGWGHLALGNRQSAILWGLAAVAAITLGIGIALRNPSPPTPTLIAIHNKPVPIPSLPVIALANAAEPANRRLHDARFAYLDRDAKDFGQYLIDQIDVLPHNQ